MVKTTSYSANTNWENEKKYLEDYISKQGGSDAWAEAQLKQLATDQAKYGGSSSSSSTGASSSGATKTAGGTSGTTGTTKQYSSTGLDLSQLDKWGGADAYQKSLRQRYASAMNSGDTDLQNRVQNELARWGWEEENPRYIGGKYLPSYGINTENLYGDRVYRVDGIDYLLGQGTYGVDYVTGGGTNSLASGLSDFLNSAYESKWTPILEELTNSLINDSFTDWTKGDQYKALANRYAENGQMSMKDMLGQTSSRTGGLASSYDVTAAQQAYNKYMAALETAAQEMYNNERTNKINNANFIASLDESDYNKWLNDRNYAYSAYQDDLDYQLAQQNYQASQNQYQDQLDQYNMSTAQEKLMTMLENGMTADEIGDDVITAAGYTKSQVNTLANNLYKAAQSKVSGGGTGTTDKTITFDKVMNTLNSNGVAELLEDIKDSTQLYNMIQQKVVPYVSNYSNAQDILNQIFTYFGGETGGVDDETSDYLTYNEFKNNPIMVTKYGDYNTYKYLWNNGKL